MNDIIRLADGNERPQYDTFLTVEDTDGQKIEIPARWLEVNPEQQLVAIALHPDVVEHFECPKEGYEARPMGLLSEQGLVFSTQITKSLVLLGWDFDEWEDPALILITPEEDSHV